MRGRQAKPVLDVRWTTADACTNIYFRRWVEDENYLLAFKKRHACWHSVWLLSCDCGRSLSLWALWSLCFAVLFALAYTYAIESFYINGQPQQVGFFDALYFSIVTFTTLGFGDVTAVSLAGKFTVAAEVIVGYVMLGGLISIFSNKLARRS